MISRILALMGTEIRVLLRNRWVATSIVLMTAFSLLLASSGSAPMGSTRIDLLTVTASSLTTLAVYLIPLIALLMSYDSIAGESDRGTLPLLFTYPVARHEILFGKFAAQLVVLFVATVIGFGAAALAIWFTAGVTGAGLVHFGRLIATSVLLGGVFLGIGNLISACCKQAGTAAALVVTVWILAVVMLDVALLSALVADDGGVFTKTIFPWLLVASPTDAFRLYNITAIEAGFPAGGLTSAVQTLALPGLLPLISLFLWPVIVLAAAGAALRRIQP